MGSQQLGIWHSDDGPQNDGNKEEHGTSTAIKEDWHDAENVNTQETTVRRDPQMLRKQHWMKNLLQQEGVSVTRSHWKTVKRRTSSSQRQMASWKMHWRKLTGQSPDEGHEQGMFRSFLE